MGFFLVCLAKFALPLLEFWPDSEKCRWMIECVWRWCGDRKKKFAMILILILIFDDTQSSEQTKLISCVFISAYDSCVADKKIRGKCVRRLVSLNIRSKTREFSTSAMVRFSLSISIYQSLAALLGESRRNSDSNLNFCLFAKTNSVSLQLIGDWFGVGPWLYCTMFESFPCGDVGVDILAE